MSLKYDKEWIKKAEQDYQTIIILSRQRKNNLSDIVCYHAHQCIEKYLKALLAKHKISIPKTHDLLFLIDRLIIPESDLGLIKDVVRELNGYAVELRYPGESTTTRDAKRAFKHVQQLRKTFSAKLNFKI